MTLTLPYLTQLNRSQRTVYSDSMNLMLAYVMQESSAGNKKTGSLLIRNVT